MENWIEFEKVLKLFESKGWTLQRIVGGQRVFTKKGDEPWVIHVKDGKVNSRYIDKFLDYENEQQ
jgi:hypothetical protein